MMKHNEKETPPGAPQTTPNSAAPTPPSLTDRVLRIARGQRSKTQHFASFRITPRHAYSTLLSALDSIRSRLDRSLIFRRSCYHGSCGTCGVLVNGRPQLACLSRVADLPEGESTIAPLPALPATADLASDPTPLYGAFPRDAAYLRSTAENTPLDPKLDTPAALAPAYTPPPSDTADPHAAAPHRLESCIECALCQSVCPVNNFQGPAVLSAHYREIVNKPERTPELLQAVSGPDGVDACESHYHCSHHCPASVYPAGDIIKLRKKLDAQPSSSTSAAAPPDSKP